MTSETIETYFEDGAWRNWADGAQLGEPHHDRDSAVAQARSVARDRGLEHIIRDEQATVVGREDHAGG